MATYTFSTIDYPNASNTTALGGLFHNASEFTALNKDPIRSGRFFARKIEEGHELQMIRRKVLLVADSMPQVA